MAIELNMPQMGYDMQEGTVVTWLKSEGSNIELGEPVAEIETDKATVEFESYAEGVLQKILVPEGAVVPVGQPIAIIADTNELASEADAPELETSPPTEMTPEPEPAPETQSASESESVAIPLGAASSAPPMPMKETADTPPSDPQAVRVEAQEEVPRIFATPVARQLADEAGIDLATISGTGPRGRVTKEDVSSAIAAAESESEAGEDAFVEQAPTDEIEPVAEEEQADESPAEELEPVAEAPVAEAEEEQAEESPSEEPAPVIEEEQADESPAEELEPVAEAPVAEAEEEQAEEPPDDEAEPVAEEEQAEELEPVAEAPVAEAEEEQAEEPPVEEPEPVAEEPAAMVEEKSDDGLMPLSRMRRQIARVTIRSKSEKPHFYVNTDIDMTELITLRAQINQALAADGVRATLNDLIIAASVIALKRHPKFNAYYEEGGIRRNDGVNVGIAMAVEEGLIMPAIVGVGDMSLRQIAVASKDIAERAQQGTLHPQEYSGGTFAISNMGMMGVTSFVAIIQPPQTAVLAVGAVQKRPVVTHDDQIAIRSIMTATLSADHRIVDGAEGAFFLNEIKDLLESPLSIIL